jgi:PAS domain S-box-containing protein
MSKILGLRLPASGGTTVSVPPASLDLVPAFAALAERAKGATELLTGAVQILAAALPFSRVLILDCAGSPLAVREAAGAGWGGAGPQALGAALLALPQFTVPQLDWRLGGGVEPESQTGCTIDPLNGSALRALNTALAGAGQADPSAAAVVLWCPLRGHGIGALLAAPDPARSLSAQDESLLRAVFAILGTALGFVLRKRHYARRLKQVRRAKMAWQGTVDALPQIVCVLDPDGTVTRANRAVETWGLGSVTNLGFGKLHELLHPGCRDAECGLATRLSQALANCQGSDGHQFEYADPVLGRELRIRIGRAKGAGAGDAGRPCARRFAVVEDLTHEQIARRRTLRQNRELRRTLEQHSEALSATHEDLRAATSKLADTQVELEETRRRHRLVLENTNAGLLMVTEGRVAYCNARFEELLGYARGALLGAAMQDLLPPGCLAPKVLLGPDGEPAAPQERVCEARRRDGESLWLRISEVGFVSDGEQARFVTAINVTEQILAEQAILASGRKLQSLSRCLISTQEDERKRIAGDLHDGIGQGLSLLKLMLQNLAADRRQAGDEGAADSLRACVDRTQEVIEDVRRLSMDLRPAVLDSGGILLALTRLCREVGQLKRGLAVHLETRVTESEIQEDLKIHLFRIVQESLNNVIKHAGARNVWVRLRRTDTGLKLEIDDDGVGFDLAEMEAPARGLGLSSIKQRASLHQGLLQIASEPGRGTRLCAVWAGSART